MELNDTNAKKAYEDVVEEFKHLDPRLTRDDENLKAETSTFHIGDVDSYILIKLIDSHSHLLIKFVSLILDSLPFDKLIDNLPALSIALNEINLRLANGRFYFLGDHIYFDISTRYNTDDTTKNINYLLKASFRAIEDFCGDIIKIANGVLSLEDFFSKTELILTTRQKRGWTQKNVQPLFYLPLIRVISYPRLLSNPFFA